MTEENSEEAKIEARWRAAAVVLLPYKNNISHDPGANTICLQITKFLGHEAQVQLLNKLKNALLAFQVTDGEVTALSEINGQNIKITISNASSDRGVQDMAEIMSEEGVLANTKNAGTNGRNTGFHR